VAGVLPIAVAAAWIPLRARLPNTDLALALVLVIGLVGWVAGTRASLVAGLTAAAAFDVLDTRPYGTLTMSRGVDVTTAVILLATGVLVGMGAARLAGYRRFEDRRSDALAVVMEASGLVAIGEDQHLITEALGAELLRALKLVNCELHLEPPSGGRPVVARDGGLVGLLPTDSPALHQIDLPVWCQGEVVAHYRLTLGPELPSRPELRVALGLADQAGAAMASVDHQPRPPDHPAQLRLLPSTGASDSDSQAAPTEAGRSIESNRAAS
jgi:hypothetical protein